MVRNYKRKSDRGRVSEDVMKRAVKMVLNEKHSRKSVSDDFSIPIKTLSRYCKKYINNNVFFLIILLYIQNQDKFFRLLKKKN